MLLSVQLLGCSLCLVLRLRLRLLSLAILVVAGVADGPNPKSQQSKPALRVAESLEHSIIQDSRFSQGFSKYTEIMAAALLRHCCICIDIVTITPDTPESL